MCIRDRVVAEQPPAPVPPLGRVHRRARDAGHPQHRRGQLDLALQHPVGRQARACPLRRLAAAV
eukprot:12195524-Alexandrium_andersonii.AAC.1